MDHLPGGDVSPPYIIPVSRAVQKIDPTKIFTVGAITDRPQALIERPYNVELRFYGNRTYRKYRRSCYSITVGREYIPALQCPRNQG